MHYPLLPLMDTLKVLADMNVGMSFSISFISFVCGATALVENAFGRERYDRRLALYGLMFLGFSILVSVVGMVYIMLVAIVITVAYLLGYWVFWRFLIKNLIAAFKPSKATKKEEGDV